MASNFPLRRVCSHIAKQFKKISVNIYTNERAINGVTASLDLLIKLSNSARY